MKNAEKLPKKRCESGKNAGKVLHNFQKKGVCAGRAASDQQITKLCAAMWNKAKRYA
ncbi:MAG: hypothetical protein HDT26_12070 [Subdoligranulum sp.]|nr:hypothetical protein [Subdoligranulum sp.]